ncbi:hypothetical protein HanRHA438_Chr16g0774331 [Helianthus annuus]|nr:hypothetical protein HanRHA438_Chr16g0774331 [Helianthus annuus]
MALYLPERNFKKVAPTKVLGFTAQRTLVISQKNGTHEQISLKFGFKRSCVNQIWNLHLSDLLQGPASE